MFIVSFNFGETMWTTKELLKARPELFTWWINDEQVQLFHDGLFHDVSIADSDRVPTTWSVNGKSLNYYAQNPKSLIFRRRDKLAKDINSVREHLLSGESEVIIDFNDKEYVATVLAATNQPAIKLDGKYVQLWNLPQFKWKPREKVEGSQYSLALEKLIVSCTPIKYRSNIGLLSKSGDRYYIGAFYISLGLHDLYIELRDHAKNAATGEPLWTK